MPRQTKAEKAEDWIIERIYRAACQGRQISVMKIPELFRVARTALRNGETPEAIAARMVAMTEGTAP